MANTGPCHFRVAKNMLLNTRNIKFCESKNLNADTIGYQNVTVLNINIRPFQTLRKNSLHALITFFVRRGYSLRLQRKLILLCFALLCFLSVCLQCFDAVGWAAGRASGLQKQSGGVLAWLSVWSEVQTCIWPTVSCSSKIQIGLPFRYRLTRIVPEKGPLNGCVCVCVCV